MPKEVNSRDMVVVYHCLSTPVLAAGDESYGELLENTAAKAARPWQGG